MKQNNGFGLQTSRLFLYEQSANLTKMLILMVSFEKTSKFIIDTSK